MGQLIDLCGKAVQLEDIKNFEKGYRKYVFCPYFTEILSPYVAKKSIFNSETVTVKQFKYIGVYPYGAVLGDREKPTANDRYAIKTDSGFIVNKIIDTVKSPIGNATRLVSNKLGIDTSINKDMRIWSRGQTFEITKWGNLPAKIKYSNGREVDVFPNTVEYKQLGESITPTTRDVPTLEVHMKNNTTLVFFGGGIDLIEVDTPYQALLNAINTLNKPRQKKRIDFSAPSTSREKTIESSNISIGLTPTQSLTQAPQWKISTNIEQEKKR